MTNDLIERLEALAEAAKSQNPRDVLPYAFELERAFASGDLVTRQEMEEAVAKEVARSVSKQAAMEMKLSAAVAKAVAEERETLAHVDWRGLWIANYDRMKAAGESKEMAGRWFPTLVLEALRARSSNKEGE